MKNIFKKLSFIFFLFFFVFAFSFAQNKKNNTLPTNKNQSSESILVATINVYNATTSKINTSSYKVSFDLNNRENIQSDIRYGVELKNQKGETLDRNIANQALTLFAGENKNISLEYILPGYISSGKYSLNIVAQNSNGLPLANIPVLENFEIKNNATLSSIDSCKLNIKDSNSSSSNYLSISDIDNLQISCLLKNNKNTNLLQIVTHKNSLFGNILDSKSYQIEGNNLTLDINTQKEVGGYVLEVFLINKDNQKISSSYILNYNVLGDNVLIQNLLLDKVNYKKNDVAKIKLFWSPFTKDKDFTLSAKIWNSQKELCGNFEKKINFKGGFAESLLKVDIKKDCSSAVADVSISDKNGKVLAGENIDTNNKEEKVSVNSEIAKISLSDSKSQNLNELKPINVVIFIVILVLIAFGVIYLKGHHKISQSDDINKL